ncbi:MMPL family transporter [Nocardioides panacihumi]|uniref:MMPL family transporter n=1 Tax=Nocardioides panacihumi TaxID=400774 RepID=A0ABN2RAG1_9ACTN
MFAALGRLASRRPWYVIAAWIVLTVLVVAFHPKVKSVTDQADFLPSHYESIKAATLTSHAFPSKQEVGATVVFDHEDGSALSAADVAKIREIAKGLTVGSAFSTIEDPIVGKGNEAAIVNIDLADGVTGQKQSDLDQVKGLRDQITSAAQGTGLRTGVTGSLAQSYDQSQSGSAAEAIVGLSTVLLIVVLLSLIFRSGPITALPIFVIGLFFSQVATGLVDFATKWFGLQSDDSTSVIMIVVLFGIGTDYILFFLFRYRERVREGVEHREAVAYAVERAGEAIASAGGAVFVAFMTLVLSSLGMFRSIGPTLAIGVAVTLVGSLTLVPAFVALIGPQVFWPALGWRDVPHSAGGRKRVVSNVVFVVLFVPYVVLSLVIGAVIWLFGWPGRARRNRGTAPVKRQGAGLGRLADAVAARPARYAAVSGAVLVLFSIFALNFQPLFNIDQSSSSQKVESVETQQRMEDKGFSAGATQPTLVLLHSDSGPLTQDQLATFGAKLGSIRGATLASSDPSVPAVVPSPGDPSTAIAQLLLDKDPSSDAAIAAVKDQIRPAVHAAAPEGTEAYVGGLTSVFVDFKAAMNRDYTVVFPVAALITLVILMLVLRSLVAPWYLMISVGLGFTATLGATTLLFQNIKGDEGLLFMLPILIYLFVVALGTDYNILMVTRLREEAREGRDPREAAAWAIRHAGPTVAAAGVILAGTFASLMLAGNSFMLTMGFSVAFGICIAAFVMAMVFTPSLTALIGHAAWWPGHGDEKTREPEAPHQLTGV